MFMKKLFVGAMLIGSMALSACHWTGNSDIPSCGDVKATSMVADLFAKGVANGNTEIQNRLKGAIVVSEAEQTGKDETHYQCKAVVKVKVDPALTNVAKDETADHTVVAAFLKERNLFLPITPTIASILQEDKFVVGGGAEYAINVDYNIAQLENDPSADFKVTLNASDPDDFQNMIDIEEIEQLAINYKPVAPVIQAAAPVAPVEVASQPVATATQDSKEASVQELNEASFDCSKAATASEKLICSSVQAAKADQVLAVAYKAALARSKDPESLKVTQRYWLKDRDACTTANCMVALLQDRTKQLSQMN